MTAPPTMKAAERTLTAPMFRARSDGSLQTWTAVKTGTMKSPPEIAMPNRSMAAWSPPPCRKRSAAPRVASGAKRAASSREIEREQSEQNPGESGRQQDDPAGGEPGREARSDRDADREDRERRRHGALASLQRVLDEGRQERQHDRADEPEPADEEPAMPEPGVGPEVAQKAGRRAKDVGIDPQRPVGFVAPGDQQARAPTQGREPRDGHAIGDSMVVGRGPASRDGPEQDRQEGAALDERIAGRQLLRRKMIRQEAVFHRAEQGRDDAEQDEGYEQQRQRAEQEADDGEQGCRDLDELQALRHESLVVAVGPLAAEPGQEQGRGHEEGACHRDQDVARAAADLEQDEKDKRIFEDVVVEGREELAPEERREAPRRHQGADHTG